MFFHLWIVVGTSGSTFQTPFAALLTNSTWMQRFHFIFNSARIIFIIQVSHCLLGHSSSILFGEYPSIILIFSLPVNWGDDHVCSCVQHQLLPYQPPQWTSPPASFYLQHLLVINQLSIPGPKPPWPNPIQVPISSRTKLDPRRQGLTLKFCSLKTEQMNSTLHLTVEKKIS